MKAPVLDDSFSTLHEDLVRLRDDLLRAAPGDGREGYDGDGAMSAHNLARYIALRSRDLRPLQRRLALAGLSSLGRCEPWVLGSIGSVVRAAAALSGDRAGAVSDGGFPDSYRMGEGRALLSRRAGELLGPEPAGRSVRVMVTMPDLAADDPGFVRSCLECGMNVMRINTASGDVGRWRSMIRHLRAAQESTGMACRVFADLPGPKIRVSRIERRRGPVDRVRLRVGDRLRVVRRDGVEPSGGPVTVHVDCPELLGGVGRGHAVWFDDGKLGAVVERAEGDELEIRVTFTKPGGQRVRVGKGLNVPDSDMETRAFTDVDRGVLGELWGEVDVFGLSFVRSAGDVRDFRLAVGELASASGAPVPGVVLKIETRQGFERLPDLLFELLHCRSGGVMIARGDLAVECGFERLAEIQEELLCFCEAAHVPVIWATDVLGTLAKLGRPTRAEITDAAVAQRAECVMLNKGPEIFGAVRTLCDILSRMEQHQVKKTAMFRPLDVACGSPVAGAGAGAT